VGLRPLQANPLTAFIPLAQVIFTKAVHKALLLFVALLIMAALAARQGQTGKAAMAVTLIMAVQLVAVVRQTTGQQTEMARAEVLP
jgi:hypothetical protein